MKMNLSLNTSQGDWSEIKDKIKSKWSKFSETEIDTVKESLTGLSEMIQKTYGYAKDRADREFEDFKGTLSHLRAPKIVPVKPL